MLFPVAKIFFACSISGVGTFNVSLYSIERTCQFSDFRFSISIVACSISGVGTFDVSLLSIDDKIFEVKSTAGNTHLVYISISIHKCIWYIFIYLYTYISGTCVWYI